jgi:hypothetical protein
MMAQSHQFTPSSELTLFPAISLLSLKPQAQYSRPFELDVKVEIQSGTRYVRSIALQGSCGSDRKLMRTRLPRLHCYTGRVAMENTESIWAEVFFTEFSYYYSIYCSISIALASVDD